VLSFDLREDLGMRALAVASVALTCGLASPASAGPKVSVKIETYRIQGKTGRLLMDAMDQRGPKHGFLTRAIAQTRYKVSWDIDWVEKDGRCSASRANADLALTYRYPEVEGPVSPELKSRWKRFFAGVRKHEEIHGKIATEMVIVAQKSVRAVQTTGDPQCSKAKREAKGRVATIYKEYETRQNKFDAVEHRDGGKVEGLVAALTKG
jgi:predicted secreted Zn-dependent protease